MQDLTPARDSLDPIEIASRDEIGALQLERLKWSLSHAYENVPYTSAALKPQVCILMIYSTSMI